MQDPEFVHGAFAKIAGRYVVTNHVLSLGIDILWRKEVAKIVAGYHPESVLDLATGSGDLAEAVAHASPDARVVGADFCEPMLEEARRKGLPELVVADGTDLFFDTDSFDALTVGFGLRNMSCWPTALKEMRRVVRPGGPVVVLDFSIPKPPLSVFYRSYLHNVMPRVAGVLTGQREAYQYLSGSIEKFPSGDAMLELFADCGLRDAYHRPLSGGIAAIYVGIA